MTNEDIRIYFETNPEQPRVQLNNIELLPPSAQKIVQLYAMQSFVRTVMTIGSLSSRKQDELSDIDLILICENEGIPPKEDRLAIINYVSNNQASLDSINLKIWNFGTADDFTINNQEICTQFFTKKVLEDKVNLTVEGFYNQIGMEHPLAALSSLLTAKVHSDKDGFYEYIRGKIDPYPEKLRQKILHQELGMRFPYYLNRLDTAIKRGDIPFAYKLIGQAIDSAVYVLFAQNHRYPNGPKRLYEQLDAMLDEQAAKEIKQCLASLFTSDITAESLPQKQELLQKLAVFLRKQQKG